MSFKLTVTLLVLVSMTNVMRQVDAIPMPPMFGDGRLGKDLGTFILQMICMNTDACPRYRRRSYILRDNAESDDSDLFEDEDIQHL